MDMRLILFLLNAALFFKRSAGKYFKIPPVSWVKISKQIESFPSRSGHASVVFKNRIYVIGGLSETYQQYNLQFSDSRGDVWSRCI
mmetsp:Transcript_11777/g.17571  ORF Transcript_11777/g.17571 Transcript_11777/m.17571 type:complete len:86 (-) Transcript_11777:101-358(-)